MDHLMDTNPEIVFFMETWLQSENNAITAEIKDFGYKLYHKIRHEERGKEMGGGATIMIKAG